MEMSNDLTVESCCQAVCSRLDCPIKAESHCSDNENDTDHDAKRTHSIG